MKKLLFTITEALAILLAILMLCTAIYSVNSYLEISNPTPDVSYSILKIDSNNPMISNCFVKYLLLFSLQFFPQNT